MLPLCHLCALLWTRPEPTSSARGFACPHVQRVGSAVIEPGGGAWMRQPS